MAGVVLDSTEHNVNPADPPAGARSPLIRGPGARRKACVLQHISCEPPGIFSKFLREHGIAVETVEPGEGDALPDWREVDLVLAMGGPMGVNDEAEHPWLAAEKDWIAAAVRSGMPYLGVCLGAQLLAASLGAEVRTGARPEVGVLPVLLTPDGRADPVFSGLGEAITALQWHGDTFGIPAGAVRLAQSAAYPNQAFRFGEVAYAVQFHVEVTDWMLELWQHVPAYQASAEAVLGAAGFETLARDFHSAHASMTDSAERMLTGWLRHAGVAASSRS
ncbi:MAG: type 1 glutamine amidotransferase [Streptosporangiaceae bacterium]